MADDTPIPEPAEVAAALGEPWMADGRAQYRKRFVTWMAVSGLSDAGSVLIDKLPVMVGGELAAAMGGGTTSEIMDSGQRISKRTGREDPAEALGSLHALMIATDNQALPNQMPINLHKLNELIADPAKISTLLMTMSGHFRLRALQDNSVADLMEDLTRGFQVVHTLWEIVDPDDREIVRLKHPLAALIESYLERPVPAARNRKATGIIIEQHFQIREFAPPDDSLVGVEVGQAMLPGLEALLPDYDEMEKFPVLAMFDALRGSDKEAGLGLRLLVTVLTEIDAQDSFPLGDSGVLVPMLLRGLTGHLWPRGWKRSRVMPRLKAAMYGWNYAGIPERGGLRRVIGTVGKWIALPDDFPLDGEIIFQVFLPPGAQQGAMVHRETLDYLGVSSGLMYRAELTLAHQWWRAAHTKGKTKEGITRGTTWPYATRPARLKDGAGNALIKKGRTVPGNPDGERETNPMIRYLPTYTDDRILRLCYSPTQIANAERTDNLHKYRARAWAAVAQMEQLGLLEKAHWVGGLKLCPPQGWGVNFEMPEAVRLLGTRRDGKG
ncbi:MAG: hypothetical protein OXO50_09200 [Caldilineaceae bacterium]|nr:hypothetical protein [Caldilineaceae bacterium]